MTYLTTDQAGEILGVSGRRVRALIKVGRLPAQKFGKAWIISKKDLEKVAVRNPGRPPGKENSSGKG
jgi:excisionase family DNA binding protein